MWEEKNSFTNWLIRKIIWASMRKYSNAKLDIYLPKQ